MKRVAFSILVAAGLAGTSAFAADMPLKAPPPAAAPASPWDVAITAALMTDYNFRGITQSDHKPSAQAGFEPRYNISKDVQLYAGISGESIDFPNHAASEIDFYGGIRPTFGKLALDFGAWYYYYPGGTTFNGLGGATSCANLSTVFCSTAKGDASFYEIYGKATYTVNDNLSLGIQEWYSPSVTNTGADGWFTTGNATVTLPGTWFPTGWGGYVSGDVGYWALGTSDAFYGFTPYRSYTTWDVGIGWTYKAFTLDLRYYDTDLSKSDCWTFTGDHTTLNGQSDWCGPAFIAKLSAAINLSGLK